MGPAAQRFGEWASASRTFSAITDLIAVVQREVNRLFKFHFLVHACSTSSCLPAEIIVDCSYVLAVRASPPPDLEMAHALRYGGESASVRAACVTVQAPFIAFCLWHDRNPIAICLLRESPRFAGRFPEHCSGKKISANIFYTARFRRSPSNDVSEN